MAGEQYDRAISVALIGQFNVGKWSLYDQYLNGTFSCPNRVRIGYYCDKKIVKVMGQTVLLTVWLTSAADFGCGRFRRQRRDLDGMAFVYDVTRRVTFALLPQMIEECVAHNEFPVRAKILIGNKIDMEDKRKIFCDEAEELAQKEGMAYIETSAKDNINVTEAFYILVKTLLESEPPTPSPVSDKKGCCNLL